MGKLAEDVKREIVSRHEAGEDAKAIAASLGIHTIGVIGVIKQHRVRQGLEPDPLEGKRGRKKRVTIKQSETIEVPPDASIGVLPTYEQTSTGPTPLLGSPLFPARPEGEIDRIEVHRVLARPPTMGTGLMGRLDAEASSDVIQDAYGGGRYELRAFNARGSCLARRSLEIAGRSKPADPDQELADAGGALFLDQGQPIGSQPGALSDRLLSEIAEMRKDMQRMRDAELERERIRMDDDRRRDREFQQERDKQKDMFFQNMLNLQAQSTAQLLALQKQSTPASSMLETVQTFQALKEVIGGDGGSDDPTSAMIKNIPGILQGVSELARAGAAAKGLPGGAPTVGQLAAAPAPNPAPSAPDFVDEGDEDEEADDDEPLNASELAREVYALLRKNGMSHEEAKQKANYAGAAVQAEVQALRQRQPVKVAPPPPQANGSAQPVAEAAGGAPPDAVRQ